LKLQCRFDTLLLMKAGSANKKSFWDIPWFKYAFIPLIVAVLAGVVLNLIFRNQSDDSSTKEKLKESKEIISQHPKKLDTSSLRDIPESGDIYTNYANLK